MMKKYIDIAKTAFRVTGKRVLQHARTEGDSLNSGDWQDALEQVRQTGIAILPGFWTSAQCREARQDFDKLLRTQEEEIWIDDKASDQRIFGMEDHSKAADDFLKDDNIRSVKHDYYQASPDLLEEFAMMNKVIFQPGNLGSGGGWHRDALHEQQLKAILYLSDVTEENGAFQYLLNTHEKSSIYKTIKENDIKYAQFRFEEKEIEDILLKHRGRYPLRTATGPAGTLILADTSGIHRGSPIQKGTRYAITQYIYRSKKIGGKGIPANVIVKLKGRS